MRGLFRTASGPLLALLVMLVPVTARADSAKSPATAGAPAAGWYEAVAVVRDLDRAVAFFVAVAQYEVIARGPADRADFESLGLAWEVVGRMAVVREPGQDRGAIRLFQLETDLPQVEIRSSANLFDTGGIAGLNVRVANIDAAFRRMQAAGWRAYADPVRLEVDGFSVSEAIFKGPDGLVIGLIERTRPALGPEWTLEDGRLSRPNNAFVVVPDVAAEAAFFARVLGWRPFLEDRGKAAAAPGPNLYGWPWNIVAEIDREVVWLHGAQDIAANGSEGSVALMHFANLKGSDFADRAHAPNYGFVALRVARTASACGSKADIDHPEVVNHASPAGILVQIVPVPCVGSDQ